MPEARLEIAIEDIRSASGFEAVVLTDLRGEILSAVRSEGTPPEALDAMLDVASQVAVRATDKIGLSKAGESEFFDWDGRRVVCRWFQARKPGVVVALIPKGKTYKWAMSRLVREIQRLIGT